MLKIKITDKSKLEPALFYFRKVTGFLQKRRKRRTYFVRKSRRKWLK